MSGDKPILGWIEQREGPKKPNMFEQPFRECECCGGLPSINEHWYDSDGITDEAPSPQITTASECPEPITLWVKGYLIEGGYGAWEIGGVFSDENLAIEACTRPREFIGPLRLNQNLPDTREEWPGAYYPKSKLA